MSANEQIVRRAEGLVSRLDQISGGGKGQSFEIYKDKMTIGRNEDCDIILPHDSVSRVHATIERNGDLGYLIFDNESKNGVFLNGSRVEASPLRNGDSVQIGLFGFKYYGLEEEIAGNNFQVALETPPENKSLFLKFFSKKKTEVSTYKPAVNKRFLLYGVSAVLLAGFYFYSNNVDSPVSLNDKKSDTDKNEANFAEKPKAEDLYQAKALDPTFTDPLISAKKFLDNPDLKDANIITAEQYFKSGLREYSTKNFQRAIDNFRSAVTLSSKHPLAKYYLELAIFESENTAKKNRELAVQYFRTLNYDRAIYYCKEVIAYLQHNPNHASLKSCNEFIQNAKDITSAAELAP